MDGHKTGGAAFLRQKCVNWRRRFCHLSHTDKIFFFRSFLELPKTKSVQQNLVDFQVRSREQLQKRWEEKLPKCLALSILGLCGRSASLHAVQSKSGPSFSCVSTRSRGARGQRETRNALKAQKLLEYDAPKKYLEVGSLYSPDFFAVFRHFCFVQDSGFLQVLHLKSNRSLFFFFSGQGRYKSGLA